MKFTMYYFLAGPTHHYLPVPIPEAGIHYKGKEYG
jgi:hypothetical protein